jgi:hypothetical protein
MYVARKLLHSGRAPIQARELTDSCALASQVSETDSQAPSRQRVEPVQFEKVREAITSRLDRLKTIGMRVGTVQAG